MHIENYAQFYCGCKNPGKQVSNLKLLQGQCGVTVHHYQYTDLPAFSDTLRTWEKCHCETGLSM